VLRQLAEDFLDRLAELLGEPLPEEKRQDLATSLVRQWVTYDGHAALIVGKGEIYLTLVTTPSGELDIDPQFPLESAFPAWIKRLKEDWKINPEQLPDLFAQLNRGQSAEVINGDGVPVRLWADPKERRKGVEPLVQQQPQPGTKRAYYKIASDIVESQFGEALNENETDELACCIARQWQKYDGAACVFVEEEQLVCTLTERDDGGCDVKAQWNRESLEPELLALGLSAEAIPEVVNRINHGQETEFRDSQGVACRLWYDPRARQIRTRPLRPPLAALLQSVPVGPVLCPACRAVLGPWQRGERQQTCLVCGQTVGLW
jgi:hypothetical protein